MRFSENVAKRLSKAGWFPTRCIAENLHNDVGIPAKHPARDILNEFGYLQIHGELDYPEDCAGVIDIIEFEPKGDTIEILQGLNKRFDVTFILLCLVDGEEEVFVSSDGSLFLRGMDISYYAPNFDVFLELILTGRKRCHPPTKYLPGRWPDSDFMDTTPDK